MTEVAEQDSLPRGRGAVAARVGGYGISQIFFQTSVWCGLFILAAFAVADWRMAALGVLGLVASTASGAVLRVDGAALRAGMHGFCGILVGAAAFAMLGAGWAAVIATVLGALACGPLTVGLNRLFATRALAPFALPATTAPFCIAAMAIHYATGPLRGEAAELTEPDGGAVAVVVHTVLTGISQVVLIDSPLAGLLILIGLLIAHWKVGLAALLGSGVAAGFAILIGEEPLDDYHGLDGYSAVLVAIAMACVFLSGRWSPWVMALIGALLAVALERALLEADAELPLFTWPYVLITWVLLVITRYVPGVRRS